MLYTPTDELRRMLSGWFDKQRVCIIPSIKRFAGTKIKMTLASITGQGLGLSAVGAMGGCAQAESVFRILFTFCTKLHTAAANALSKYTNYVRQRCFSLQAGTLSDLTLLAHFHSDHGHDCVHDGRKGIRGHAHGPCAYTHTPRVRGSATFDPLIGESYERRSKTQGLKPKLKKATALR
jgi:hypothetical protein